MTAGGMKASDYELPVVRSPAIRLGLGLLGLLLPVAAGGGMVLG
jgi:hypothetical protein